MRIKEMKKLVKDVDAGKVRILKPDDEFQFKCTACGKCCFNNEIILNIYDLIRLRQATKLQTQEIFKSKFVNFYLGPSSGLPVLTVNFVEIGSGFNRCPFLAPAIHFKEVMKRFEEKTKSKKEMEKLFEEYKKNPEKFKKDLEGVKIDRWLCAIHKHRPMICRLFPLGRIKKYDKKLNLEEEVIIIQNKVDWCNGWKQKNKYTLKKYLNECDFWHYKEGSDKSYAVIEKLVKSGCFAATKDNVKGKPKPLFQEDSQILPFIGNLLYNFDSFNYFSKDDRVIKTIKGDAKQEDFIYVVSKIDKIIGHFVQLFKVEKFDEKKLIEFTQKLKKGGEKNNGKSNKAIN